MASWMFRGRSQRSSRSIRSRKDSEDDYVQLDSTKDASEVATEILSNLCRRQGVTEGKKLGYLNALVTFITKTDVFPNFGYSNDELLCCLRLSLIHEAPQVRAAGLRCLRYVVRDEQDVAVLLRLQVPALIARSLDVVVRNDMERVQAMRLCRRMLRHAPHLFPKELARCLTSLARGGAEERDKMLRACLATLAELCVLNPPTFISSGGVAAISHNILEPHPPRVTEALAGVLLFLLTRACTRQPALVDLSLLAAPYSDSHYRHSFYERDKDEREMRIGCAKLALLSVLRSFPGVLHFCEPSARSGLRSLVEVLMLRQLEARKAVLDLLYDLLGLPLPAWTDEASVALEAVDPSKMQDGWKLTEGFVAAEGKSILPNLSRFRPNLVEVHTSLLLHSFVSTGLLEALVEVIVTSDSFISLRAAILLGELLQLVQTLLPAGCRCSVPSLPSLLAHASGSGSPASCQAALSALATLSRLHAMFKRRPAPCSLFLDQLLTFAGSWHRESIAGHRLPRSQLYQMIVRDTEENIKESVVLSNKDPFFWNWNVIRSILKSRCESFRRLDDSSSRTFVRRLVEYFKPSSNRFSRQKLGQPHTHPYTLAGCELLDFLVESEEGEASRALAELLEDISEQLAAIQGGASAHDCLFSPHHVTHSMCQDYFLFLGRLCHHSRGTKALENAGIFQRLLDLAVNTNHDCYVKLIVSSLDYTIDGIPRVILGKVLKSPVEASRLYATRFLLVLARAHVADFTKWGIELLVMQLYDPSPAVSLAASDILDEVCDYKPYLESLVALRPSLLHLGDRGHLLLVRFLSLPAGFAYLHDANFVVKELEKWNNTSNIKYVHIMEALLHDALTLHQKGDNGSYTGRLSSAKHVVRDAFLPPHLLGQLAQHPRGVELMSKEMSMLQRHFQVMRAGQCSTEEEVLSLKSSIWALAHCGSSPGGLQVLTEASDPEAVTVADCLATLAEECPHYGVRATAFYACALLATTQPGVAQLEHSGWVCVKHARHDRFPVTEGDENLPPIPLEGELARDKEEIHLEIRESRRKRSTSQCSTQSAASWAAHFYIDTDEDTDEDVSERGYVNTVMLREQTGISASPRRESGIGSLSPVLVMAPPLPIFKAPVSHRRSQTLPHSKPAKGAKRHQRSLSESKGDIKIYSLNNNLSETPRRNSLSEEKKSIMVKQDSTRVRKKGVTTPVCVELLDRRGDEVDGTKKFLSVPEPVDKSRSNSCTDSGTSSCDDYSAKPPIAERMPTLSTIPSSASLNTLKSAGQLARGQSARTRALSTQEDSREVMVEIDRALLGASWQEISGFAAMRRFRPPPPSDSNTLDLLGEEMRPTRASVMPRQSSPSISLHEGEPPLRRIASSLSSVCSRPPTQPAVTHIGPCYRGIALPTDLMAMFPQPQGRFNMTRPVQRRRRAPESFSELEEVQEAGPEQEEPDASSLSDSEAGPDPGREHDASRCLACSLLRPSVPQTPQSHGTSGVARGRRVSTGSHRTRTDTESSGERTAAGDSPVLGKKTTALLAATAATPNSASSMSSLDMGMSQRTEEAAAALGKHAVKKEILKHIERLANPVWAKSSRQILLQLKQKFASSFHDTCLYSDVCALLGSSSYRLSARRCVQELFLDCPFDELYEEPATILRLPDTLSASSAQPSPFNSPSITVAEMLDSGCLESKPRALDVVTEELSATSRTGELTDTVSGHSPSVLNSQTTQVTRSSTTATSKFTPFPNTVSIKEDVSGKSSSVATSSVASSSPSVVKSDISSVAKSGISPSSNVASSTSSSVAKSGTSLSSNVAISSPCMAKSGTSPTSKTMSTHLTNQPHLDAKENLVPEKSKPLDIKTTGLSAKTPEKLTSNSKLSESKNSKSFETPVPNKNINTPVSKSPQTADLKLGAAMKPTGSAVKDVSNIASKLHISDTSKPLSSSPNTASKSVERKAEVDVKKSAANVVGKPPIPSSKTIEPVQSSTAKSQESKGVI